MQKPRAVQPREWVRSRHMLTSGAVYVRHCNVAFMKHVLPKLANPGPMPLMCGQELSCSSRSGGKRYCSSGRELSRPAASPASSFSCALEAGAAAVPSDGPLRGGLRTVMATSVVAAGTSGRRAGSNSMRWY